MKKVLLMGILIFLSLYSSASVINEFDYYTTVNLRLRTNPDNNSSIISLLPKYTALKIIEEGDQATINGIEAKWVKVQSQTGLNGWCFSGYIKQIEKKLAEDIAITFAKRKSGDYPKQNYNGNSIKNVSFELIQKKMGYYIQQEPRNFQGSGHAPEILELATKDDKVYIREVDVVNMKKIIRYEIELEKKGNTYSKGLTHLESIDDTILIFYREHQPQKIWLGTWEFEKPYSFSATDLSPSNLNIYSLTSDYLKTFQGKYAYDSYKIIKSENFQLNESYFKNAVLPIEFNKTDKCLSIKIHDLIDFYQPNNGVGDYTFHFVETMPSEPFSWTYGEGVGFCETMFYFYKGGIAFTYEESSPAMDDDEKSQYIKYVVFFKKVTE